MPESTVKTPPAAAANTGADIEIKSGVIQVENTTKTHLRVNGLRGLYRNVIFKDDHVSDRPVSDEVEEELRNVFKGSVERVEPTELAVPTRGRR